MAHFIRKTGAQPKLQIPLISKMWNLRFSQVVTVKITTFLEVTHFIQVSQVGYVCGVAIFKAHFWSS